MDANEIKFGPSENIAPGKIGYRVYRNGNHIGYVCYRYGAWESLNLNLELIWNCRTRKGAVEKVLENTEA